MRCYEVLWGVMGCYEQPAITAITPVMAAPITLSGDNLVHLNLLCTLLYAVYVWCVSVVSGRCARVALWTVEGGRGCA